MLAVSALLLAWLICLAVCVAGVTAALALVPGVLIGVGSLTEALADHASRRIDPRAFRRRVTTSLAFLLVPMATILVCSLLLSGLLPLIASIAEAIDPSLLRG